AVLPRCQVTPRSSGSRQMLSSDFPFQSAFDRGGRLYGGWGSLPITPIDPAPSISRMPRTAASPVIPPPTIRYLQVATVSPSAPGRPTMGSSAPPGGDMEARSSGPRRPPVTPATPAVDVRVEPDGPFRPPFLVGCGLGSVLGP